MYNRKIKLIRALLGHEKMSSAELMDKLDISQRTLRNEVKEVNEILSQENVGIHSSNTGGYFLEPEEKQKVQKVLDGMIRKSKDVILPETPDERFLFGFATLFFEIDPISIQRAAEKLYVSKTAMLQTKKEIQDACRWYHGLTLEVSSKGTRIVGPEKIRRHALAEVINYHTYGSILMERVITFLFGSEKYEDYIALYQALPAILQQQGYRLIDKAIEGFALDIFISLMRREKGFELEADAEDYEPLPCVEAICRFLEKQGYDIPKQEQSYMEECLKAKRILYTQGKTYEVPEEYTELTDEFLKTLDWKYHTDYRNNEELFTRLSVHIRKMVERIEQGYFETNPTLEEVFGYYEREVRMAEELNQILQKKYQFIANVHEICYVALYLKAYDFQRLRAVILCDIGESFADNMARQITDYCGEKIHILDKMSLAEYRLNPIPVDLVISGSRVYGVEFPQKTKIIYVDYLLKEENLKAIQEYLMKEGTDYDKDDCN